VENLMVRDVAVIQADHDVHELEKMLLREEIHGVPVIDDAGRLVGVVSQTDLLAWHYSNGVDGASYYDVQTLQLRPGDPSGKLRLSDIRSATVAEVMSPVVHCICPDQSIALAAARMITRRVHRLVVVDGEGRVVGSISPMDLLRAMPGVEEETGVARKETIPQSERSTERGHPVRIQRDEKVTMEWSRRTPSAAQRP
jgi:CBS-domain-containing membrane protein